MKRYLDKSLIRLLIGLSLGILVLQVWSMSKHSDFKQREFALGEDNMGFYGNINGKRVHCNGMDDKHVCENAYITMKKKLPVILHLGNSQLHVVNQYNNGDELTSQILHKKFIKNKMYYLTLSQANANFQEHFALLKHNIDRYPIRVLVLPLVYDDLREDGVRSEILNLDKEINLIDTKKKKPIQKQIDSFEKQIDSFEKNTKNFFFTKSNLWSKRPKLQSVVYGKLYKIRNTVFNIDATTIRKKIPERYKKNFEALINIIKLAKLNNIKAFFYVAPIRQDINLPYDLEDYELFKKEAKIFAEKNGVHFFNYERLIPKDNWGFKRSTVLGNSKFEIDFMHFRSKGHILLSDKVYEDLTRILKK